MDNDDKWGDWCRTCERGRPPAGDGSCSKLCTPLADRMRTRFSSKRSVKAKAFTDIPNAERLVVSQALYGDAEMLTPHKRRRGKG